MKVTVARCVASIGFYNDFFFNGWFDKRYGDVLAFIEIESEFDASAFNPEDGTIVGASRGLMQVRLSTARDRGYKGLPADLFKPDTNIHYGMAHLKWSWEFLDERGVATLEMWVASYNEGVGNVLKGFTDASYVTRWKLARKHYAS